MRITWEDRKQLGKVDNQTITKKPELSFVFAWFLVNDAVAEFVESHEYGFYNKKMSEAQRQEVIDYYNSWEPPKIIEPTEQEVLENWRNRASITMRQFWQQLFLEGVTEDQAIATINSEFSDPEKTLALIELKKSTSVDRNRAFLTQLAPYFGYDTPEKIDEFFKRAVQL